MELQQRYTWSIFQSIEYAGELDQMKLYNFFNALLEHLEDVKEPKPVLQEIHTDLHSRMYSSQEDLRQLTDPASVPVELAYRGPRVNFPMGPADLNTLIEAFKNKKLLHVHYVYGILHEAVRVLRPMASLHHASTAVSRQITVCGDLHGKLDDLLVIFHKNGMPSIDNPYVFNGDFVDRGKKSIEVLLILLACVVVNPHEVYLNRGNHEDPMMNARYGFTREVIAKYKAHASPLLALITEVFSWLPIGTVIDNKVLVVHGGISSQLDVAWLQNVDRHQYASVLRLPDRAHVESPTENLRRNFEWKQMLDVLWSDPQTSTGCCPNTFRGGGCYFGPDVTDKVLRLNQLQLLIRSHECKADGYEFTHDGKCLTIFSASNYYGPGSNRGAYVVLQGAELRPHFVQFTAQTKAKYISMRQRVGALEASALNELRKKILASKQTLMHEFKKHDPARKGLIPAADWVAVMERHCSSTIPWRTLREKIVAAKSNGQIPYVETFSEAPRPTGPRASTQESPSVVEALYRNRDRLETIFGFWTRTTLVEKRAAGSRSRFLSLDEFADAAPSYGNYLCEPIPYDEMVNMARSMDINKDGFIDFNEFLETFRLVDMEGSYAVEDA
ncbi:serine/threonine-protein phosphatase with EF-hands 2-like [Pollicipes pollicipes]|uniref:serine/threonine-protein phosphatase with EF-hands 2-like n=1 Tax=Pollicipes pollicipes TaxID=41117 RepID=UPI001884C9BF|nr:serine/threonine-protein phosphatase with EF-hands 2-like [Pollicipes pollicipes]